MSSPPNKPLGSSGSFAQQFGTSTDGGANSVRVQQGLRLTPRYLTANILHHSLGDLASARTARHRHERGNGAG
ncbi:expressed unknown protein [Ectocarpus siliculosus]|uniref:Uncharacterized protein n=1 Tax=Ectocarpus siliculosus TaxID=2880 RepID=D7FHS3_ECTSI|nr:expressed unknown protein [Ectocarpus siliculosus]|eukprot:CBJ28628.1 expressed unknown protein [Ectocarpus siliculosus]